MEESRHDPPIEAAVQKLQTRKLALALGTLAKNAINAAVGQVMAMDLAIRAEYRRR
jgi:hypothetical protein